MKSGVKNQVTEAVVHELGDASSSMKNAIERAFDLSIRDIANMRQWSWLETPPFSVSTDSGKTYITLPTYIGEVRALYSTTGGKEMTYISPAEYARRMASSGTSTSTIPDFFTVIDRRIYFAPALTSGTSIVLIGWINTDLSADATDPSGVTVDKLYDAIPDHFQQVIEWDVLRRVSPDPDDKQLFQNYFMVEIKEKKYDDRRIYGARVRPMIGAVQRGTRRFTNA